MAHDDTFKGTHILPPPLPTASTTDTTLTFKTELLQNGYENPHTLTSPENQLSHNFGILTTTTPKTPLRKNAIHFVLSIDHSGSMMSAMELLKATIKNILNYLCNLDTQVYISILLFNTETTTLVKHASLTEELTATLIDKVSSLEAYGMTNMEQLFNELNTTYMKYVENVHLFMTDGEPTQGIQTTGGLTQVIQSSPLSSPSSDLVITPLNNKKSFFEHHLMGFGTEHNEKFLTTMTNNLNGEYYFIDTMENAGLVYGEILNNILYRKFEYITFTTLPETTLEFYDYKTNTWSNTYTIRSLSSEQSQTIHIRFPWEASPRNLEVEINYVTLYTDDDDSPYVSHQLQLHQITDYKKSVLKHEPDRNPTVTKYLYRQRVLELLYDVNNTQHEETMIEERSSPLLSDVGARIVSPTFYRVEHNNELKEDLKSLFEEITAFMEANELTEDTFMKQLKDDLYIAHISFNNENLSAYSVSRHLSQAQQRAYNVSTVDSHISVPRRRRRGTRLSSLINTHSQPDYRAFSPFSNMQPSPTASLSSFLEDPPHIRRAQFSIIEPDDPTNQRSPFDGYSVSIDPMTPYATPQQRKTMTQIHTDF